MLFAAGMGIGLMFFGVAEPIDHFLNPPLGVDPADTAAVHRLAIAAAIFHWGVHPWAMFAVVALALGFSAYNLGLPLTLRSGFYPLLGEAVWGWFGHVVDIVAVFAALFGLATSLGLGAQQMAAGLDHLFGVPATDTTRVLLIAGITGLALASVVMGLDRGVKRLSQANLVLALLLLAFVLAAGPTADLLGGFVASLGHYVAAIAPLSNSVGARRPRRPARVGPPSSGRGGSRGPPSSACSSPASRAAGRCAPSSAACSSGPVLVSALWMNAFGTTALLQYLDAGGTAAVEAVQAQQPELALFRMLETLPLSGLTSVVGIVLVMVFFVTSSDSGSLVIDTITAGGKLDAPVAQRVFWCAFEGIVAITLLLGGGLVALQTASLVTGFPIALVMLAMCCSIWKGLRAAVPG